ncbi:flagellar hook protein FlgE [Oceaniglobus ichthyenteri]|uniref:flagellar hook protein FlgE n=1 Tax=Oceaniglobus ichthyenteri TaxID=2136177 RepID=UPI000D3979D8|nr:flagellar hook-basal body complex protein [Oceaniglobus ichthyenteri]
MTIYSSMAAGVAGLNANAQRLAGISDNIANSSTFGHKRMDTDFHSMVVNGGQLSAGRYTAGGVTTTTSRDISMAGQVVGTDNPMDISIEGRGMLPVTDIAALGRQGDLPLSLMTTGSFRPNNQGILVNSAGQVLMGWPLNGDGTLPSVTRDTSAALAPVNIRHNQSIANPTTAMTMGVNLPSAETLAGAAGTPLELSMEYFGNLGQPESLTVTYTPDVPATGRSDSWTMVITDSASGGGVVGEYQLTFDDTAGNGGRLATVTDVAGGAYDPATGSMPITVGGGDIQFSIGQIGGLDGMTQLSSSFAPTNLTKNGSPVGNLLGVEIDPSGVVNAVYDTGFTRPIYQVPLVDVPNPDGLISTSNQTYKVSPESGAMFLWDAGDGPTGSTRGYSLEGSTTDIAVELTNLIQTQRAYSSNAKIIQTVDEMLQETTNLKR